MRVIVTDDLDGTEGAETVQFFSLDGEMFEIDLSEDNHAKLKQALSPFIEHGRKAAPARPGRSDRSTGDSEPGPGLSGKAGPPPSNWSQRRRATTKEYRR